MADQADTAISNAINPALPLAGTPPLSRGGEPGRTPALLNRRVDQPVGARDSGVEARKLIVGRETSLSGEITSCDRLVVEGSVEANLQNCQHMTITETGVFKGNAAIDDVEVSGRFEGDLVVRKRLLIRASGHVSGTITYGEIEIEAGAPNAMFRRGFNRNSLPIGTEVIVNGFQAKDGRKRANGRDISFPDGKKLFMGSSGTGVVMRVESVAWATERKGVLCGLLVMISLLAYLRMDREERLGRTGRAWLLLSVAMFVCSLFSKVLAITLPFVLLALDVYPLRRFAAAMPREVWRYEKSFIAVVPSPLFYEGVLYVLKNGGLLTSFNPNTGSVEKASRVSGALGGSALGLATGCGSAWKRHLRPRSCFSTLPCASASPDRPRNPAPTLGALLRETRTLRCAGVCSARGSGTRVPCDRRDRQPRS
jgi:cytoskeletal protein CcmA (bactofilin family)